MLVEKIENIDKRRFLIKFSDESFFPLYKSDIRKYGIEEGSEITTEIYKYIMSELVYKRGKERALYILGSSDKTEKQLRDKLAGGYYPPAVIDGIIDFLKLYGYLDDYEYALNYIKTYTQSQSIRAVKMKLAMKGMDKSIIDNAIEEYLESNEYDSKKLIYDILRKKRFNSDNPDIKERNSIISHLLRKGFKYDEIFECIKNFNKNLDDEH